MEVTSVVSMSEAVMVSVLPFNSKRKLSRMGNEFLLLITRLMACRWLSNSVLEAMNFIFLYIYVVYFVCNLYAKTERREGYL